MGGDILFCFVLLFGLRILSVCLWWLGVWMEYSVVRKDERIRDGKCLWDSVNLRVMRGIIL